jgi:predicted  nucleic acid-binding Zn-ribbon protein
MVAQLEARCAALEEQATELMAETEALAEEGLAKDEEIEALEGKLSHALRQAGAGGAQVSRRRLHGDVMTVHQSKEAEGCIVVMWGLDKRIVCS